VLCVETIGKIRRWHRIRRWSTPLGDPDHAPPGAPNRGVFAVQPIFAAIEPDAAHCESCSSSCSKTNPTARSRTSGEYLFDVLMTPSSQEMEFPGIPGRFMRPKRSSRLSRVPCRNCVLTGTMASERRHYVAAAFSFALSWLTLWFHSLFGQPACPRIEPGRAALS
jgi:hypothetical protein